MTFPFRGASLGGQSWEKDTSCRYCATPAPLLSPSNRQGPAPVPRIRGGATWVGVCAVAVIAVSLIVFTAQDTPGYAAWSAGSTADTDRLSGSPA